MSNTHKGEIRTHWSVSLTGGVVDCVSYQTNADRSPLYDGVVGLFFISASPEFPGDTVRMTIAEHGPDWFVFTEEGLGSIEDAVELVRSLE